MYVGGPFINLPILLTFHLATALSFAWSCVLSVGGTCRDSYNEVLSLDSSAVLIFPAYSLLPSAICIKQNTCSRFLFLFEVLDIFTVIVSSSDGRKANATASISVVPGSPPTAIIAPLLYVIDSSSYKVHRLTNIC